MKKLFGFLALLALVSLAKPAPAAADGVALGVFCQLAAPGAGLTQGECAKLLASLGPVICKQDSNNNGIPDFQDAGFKNNGECVSWVQQLIRDALRAAT